MRHGSLLNYLRRHENSLGGNNGLLLDMCIQVSDTFCLYIHIINARIHFTNRFAKEWPI